METVIPISQKTKVELPNCLFFLTNSKKQKQMINKLNKLVSVCHGSLKRSITSGRANKLHLKGVTVCWLLSCFSCLAKWGEVHLKWAWGKAVANLWLNSFNSVSGLQTRQGFTWVLRSCSNYLPTNSLNCGSTAVLTHLYNIVITLLVTIGKGGLTPIAGDQMKCAFTLNKISVFSSFEHCWKHVT